MKEYKFTPFRPQEELPPEMRFRVTAGTLFGSAGMVTPPFIFRKKDGHSLISLQYLDKVLCRYPGVYGGLVVALLDETFAWCSALLHPNNVGLTANLNIDFKKPCGADQVTVIRGKIIKVEGIKVRIQGKLETVVDGCPDTCEVLAEAKALFVGPKQIPVGKPLDAHSNDQNNYADAEYTLL